MSVQRFEDLVTWQLAYQLQQEVFAFTATGSASRDLKYRDQIRESSRSAPRNTAEGFGRYYPREFIRFLRFAAGSLHETKNHLRDGLDRRYLTADEFERLNRLAIRAIKANVRLTAYLQDARAPQPFAKRRDDRPGAPENDDS
jgi:four helix bundle protein